MVMPAVVGALKVTEVPSSFYNLLITALLVMAIQVNVKPG